MTSLALTSPQRATVEFVDDARRLREDSVRGYREVDLLVAALRDHVRDLQQERDQLRAELAQVHAVARLGAAEWMWRGMKATREIR
ncbi:MAG: hypothetical protein ABIP13_06645 [Tepidiformaceae bacterium]